MSSPTEAQIEKVKNNLTNMIAWNQQNTYAPSVSYEIAFRFAAPKIN